MTITTEMMLTMMSRASWNLRSILGIDEDAQTISLDATIRFQWRDSRVGRHPSNGLEKNATFFFKVKGLPQTGDHVTITPRGNSATDITKVFSHMLKEQHFFHGLLKDALDAGLLLGQSQGGERESLGRPPCSLCQVNMCGSQFTTLAHRCAGSTETGQCDMLPGRALISAVTLTISRWTTSPTSLHSIWAQSCHVMLI